MIKFFLNIRQKLLSEGPPAERAGKTGNPAFAKTCATARALGDMRSAGTYLKYAIGEIVLAVAVKILLCPVRDFILVARINTKSNPRAFGYGILYDVPKGTKTTLMNKLLPR